MESTSNCVNIAKETLTIQIGGGDSSKKRGNINQSNRIKSTKYTLITFLPLNLAEQFRRIANFYFLVMSIIALLIDSPVSPFTSLLPLAFVISLTATKQAYEDYLRHKTDNIVNRSLVTVIREGKEINIRCQDIVQGDLVQVTENCDIPCDLVVLKSSVNHGKCYVTTANLDGESNLKTLYVPKKLPQVPINRIHTLGTIECEKPRAELYSFNGKIKLSAHLHRFMPLADLHPPEYSVLPLAAENLLLRGSRLKNTEWVIGCAVYTGQMTKLALNSRITRSKRASSEHYINRFLVFVLVLLICIVTFCYIYKRYFEIHVVSLHSYLGPSKEKVTVGQFLQDYLSFLILFNYIIPISLYVTIEMHKFLGSLYMEWDYKLFDEATNQPCIVNTSDLNDELGQVNIIFSDKTGTLTKNEMYLQKVSINGHVYNIKGTKIQDATSKTLIDINKFKEAHLDFFQVLALCHTVQVAKNPNEEQDLAEVQNLYGFYDIKEEGPKSQASTADDVEETDYIQVAKSNNLTSDDNPLLKKNSSDVFSLTSDRMDLDRMSSRMGGNRVHPASTSSLDSFERPLTYPNAFQVSSVSGFQFKNFQRSTSHIDIQTTSSSANTHRRSQSYGAPITNQRRTTAPMSSRKVINEFLASKQGYAMPSYTRESLATRAESIRRKEVIKNVVEKLDYQASSPDEKALIEACASLGMIYMGDENEILTLHQIPPHISSIRINIQFIKKRQYTRLDVLEFSSNRKRMSVILQDDQSNIWLLTKGAENVIFALCGSQSENLISKTNAHINEFAKEGLRTLAIARRKLNPEEYKEFRQELMDAKTSLNNRAELIAAAYRKVENNLELIGATAVEDALQDYVRETMEALQKAGIKIWVLTGDKIETAYNIALSCGHISENCARYYITECTNEIEVTHHLKVLNQEMTENQRIPFALLIDGVSLRVALSACAEDFRTIAVKCQAVLCCRLSPLQKCEVVRLVKDDREKFITAAIGDGANDVSMIQEAHIGFGIVGKEGRQAARCADYAFANFSMVKRLLLVHGHYFTKRLSILVLYFFYKNIVFMGVQFLFQMNNCFSTSSIYDSVYLTLFNVLHTSVPVLVLSLTEKPYKDHDLEDNPKLYLVNTKHAPLQWSCFLSWTALGIYHAVAIYMITYIVLGENNAILSTPYTADITCFGTLVFQNVVILVNFKLWMEAQLQTYFFIATIWLSIVMFMASTIVYNVINVRYDSDMYWTYINLLSSFTFWLLTVIEIVACLVPDYTILTTKQALNLPKLSIFAKNVKKNINLQIAQNSNVESTML